MLLTLPSWFVLIGSRTEEESRTAGQNRGVAKGRRERFKSDWPTTPGVAYPNRGREIRAEEMGGAVDPNFSPLPPARR